MMNLGQEVDRAVTEFLKRQRRQQLDALMKGKALGTQLNAETAHEGGTELTLHRFGARPRGV